MAVFDERPVRGQRRSRISFGWIFGIVLFLILFGMAGLEPYKDFLWFRDDAGQLRVFLLAYETKGALFVGAFVVALIPIYFSLKRALRLSLVYLDRPMTVGQVLAAKALDLVQSSGTFLTKVISVVLAILFASGFAREWNTLLLWRHGQAFGVKDPLFGLDLSYFAFKLPWLLAVVNSLLGLAVMVLFVTLAVYVAVQSIASVAKIELGRPAIQAHLWMLGGAALILFAFQLWLNRFQYGLMENAQFTGAGYVAVRQLPLQTVLAVLIGVVGLLALLAAVRTSLQRLAVWGIIACTASYLIGLGIYPAILQVLKVNPNIVSAESPYAQRAIQMTRYAYGLDQIQTKETNVRPNPTEAEVKSAKATFDNMRLWDPELLRRSAEASQGLKPYYDFKDIDIDRYPLAEGGKNRLVMLGVRDIDPSGLNDRYRTWVNTRLQYTHGYGIIVSPVNTADSTGQPNFLVRDIPVETPPELPIKEPRVYFSDFSAGGRRVLDNYVIVNTNQPEFDYPSEANDRFTKWTGTRGVKVGSFVPRLAMSLALGDFNILTTPNFTRESRLLMRRGVLERSGLIYPFLTFDGDPYIVVLDGRLVWVLDGYTTSDRVPYSARTTYRDKRLNYIRNPIKVVIDAYSGDANAYAIGPAEPVLETYRRIYPGLIQDASAMPAGLERHLRYPEDMLMAQALQLTQYHVTEPVAFLNNEDAWDMPRERGINGGDEAMRPYYVQMSLPGEPRDEFLQILPFTPRLRGNLSGWLAAHCDPDRYGQLRLYKYPKGNAQPGPKQMEAYFNQNPDIANLNTLLANEQSKVIVGNLLVVPVGNSVMYVEPMFLESHSPGIPAIPQLKKVILALKDRVVVADTYEEAVKKLFGESRPVPVPVGEPHKPTPQPTMPSADWKVGVQEALRIANEADAALRAGDFAKYGELQKRLKAKLQEMAK